MPDRRMTKIVARAILQRIPNGMWKSAIAFRESDAGLPCVARKILPELRSRYTVVSVPLLSCRWASED
jgi:hypothetical protein